MHREGSEKGAELAPTRSSGIDLSPRLPFTAAASHDPGLPPERPPPTQLCAAPVPPGPHSLLPSCCPSSLLKTGDTRQLSKQKQHWYRSKPRALLDHRAGGGARKNRHFKQLWLLPCDPWVSSVGSILRAMVHRISLEDSPLGRLEEGQQT